MLSFLSAVLPTRRCNADMSLKQCTHGMDDRAFGVYSQFFTNIHR